MSRTGCGLWAGLILALAAPAAGGAADDTVATAVYARVGKGYKRERLDAGRFKPEFYALSNGGQYDGTAADETVKRVTYPEVAEVAMRLLARQDYHFARSKEQAQLLIVLQWGNTIPYNRLDYDMRVAEVVGAVAGQGAKGDTATALLKLEMEERKRRETNLPNAQLLGFLGEINSADGIQRLVGAGTRYDDLVADLEETRYYIVVSAYDFRELTRHDRRKLLWQTRVSVRAPGNRFDDSFAAMLKAAAQHFGQNSDGLVRQEETKGTVELGDLKFLGEAREPVPATKSPGEKQK